MDEGLVEDPGSAGSLEHVECPGAVPVVRVARVADCERVALDREDAREPAERTGQVDAAQLLDERPLTLDALVDEDGAVRVEVEGAAT